MDLATLYAVTSTRVVTVRAEGNMVSLWLIFAIVVLLNLDTSAKADDKVVIYNKVKKSSPSYNEVPFDPSKPIDIFQDLLGLKSIASLNYNLPTLEIPLVQQPSQGSFNDEKAKPTSPPPPPLPPPPPAPKQHTTPTTRHNYPTVVPYRRPSAFYHQPDNNNEQVPPRTLPSRVEYKHLPDGTNYEKPVTRFVIVSQRPLPSTDDARQLSFSPSALSHPIPPPKRSPATTYSGPPRVAVHNKHDLEEAKSVRSQAPVQAAKPQLAQLIHANIGPRYYLPQPTAGNEGYYGAFKNTPDSFDALLKSDLSFLDHLNYNPNITEQTLQANAKEESQNSENRGLPPQGNDPSYKSESENRNYYPPPPHASQPLSPPAIQSHSSSYPSSQSTEEKGNSYHKPVPAQKPEKQHNAGPTLDDIAYGYIPTKASQPGKGYPDIQGIYAIQGQSQERPVPGYILERPAVIEYKPVSGHNNERVEPEYVPQPQHSEAPNNYRQQEQFHQSSVNYVPEKQSYQSSPNYRQENNLKQAVNYSPEGHHNQPQVNYRPESHPNQPVIHYRPDGNSYQPTTNHRTKDHVNYPAPNYSPDGYHNQPPTSYSYQDYPTRSVENVRSEGHPTNAALYRTTGHPTRSAINYRPDSQSPQSARSYSSEDDARQSQPSQYQSANEPRNYRGEGHNRQAQVSYRVEPRPDVSQESKYAQETDRYQRRPDSHSNNQEYYDHRQRPSRERHSSDKSDEDRHTEKETRARDSDGHHEDRRSYRNEDEERPQHRDARRYRHGEESRHRPRNEDYDDDDEPFDNNDGNVGHRRLKRQVATVTEKYQQSSNDPSVLKVFRAITVNGTDGIMVDERYVRNKDGKAVNVYTHSQPLTDSASSTNANVKDYIPTPVPQENERFATLTDITTEATVAEEQETAVLENVEETDVPECAKNHSIPICTKDDDYPMEEIVRALTQYSKFVRKLSGLSLSTKDDDDKASNGPWRPLSEKGWTNICPSYVSHIKPLRARNLKGEWKIIVNVNEIRQNLNIETCLTLGEKCSLVPLSFKTQCDQKYAVLHLLTYDSQDGLAVDQFLVPAACSCSVAKS